MRPEPDPVDIDAQAPQPTRSTLLPGMEVVEISPTPAPVAASVNASTSICGVPGGRGFETQAEPTSPVGNADACLLEDELLEYQAGRCSEAQLARVDAHLDGCASCRELVHHLLGGLRSDGEEVTAWGKGWLTTFMPGSLVASRYRIRRFVGKGGMGEVYEAFDQLMAMRVALKTVLCTASDRPHAVHKLMDEVKNALRVGHPNVCRINELQVHHDALNPSATVPFFTMEFVDGERLGQRSKRGALPLADARSIARQLLDGLRAAHARGVLHLDLKGDNVMLRRGKSPPEVVIMDFGLSRALDRPSQRPRRQRLELAGTVPYMSVEQLESEPTLGPATDVYSFGVVLYEMLTGRLPFVASSSRALLLEQLQTRPPPPSHHVPSLAPALDRFVLRCLCSQASQRFPHAGAALEALEAIGRWERWKKEPRWRGWKLGTLIGGGVLAGALTFALFNRREPEPAARLGALVQPAVAASVGAASSLARSNAADRAAVISKRRAAISSSSESSPRGLPALPLMPPAPEQMGSKPRAQLASAGDAPAMVSSTPSPLPRSELPMAASPRPPERSAASIAPREAKPPADDAGSTAPPAKVAREDWTPRALPRSLLVPGRGTIPKP